MADDAGQDGKNSRPVRKSKQIADDMRLAMMMASQLSKQIDKEEKAGASDFKKKKAAEVAICPPPAPLSPLQSSGSPSNSSSKKPKHESTGATPTRSGTGTLDISFLLQWGLVIKPGRAFQKPVFDPSMMDARLLSCPINFQIGQVLRFAQEFLPPIEAGQKVVYTARCRGIKICNSITLLQLSQRIWDASFGVLTLVVSPEEPCPNPMQASMLLERNPSLVPLQNHAILEEKLAADDGV